MYSEADDPKRLIEIVAQALAYQPEDRDEFLVQAAAGDEERLRHLRELLELNVESSFLEPRHEPLRLQPGALAGSRLGEFELVEEIGRGGMGVVYRAHQPSVQRDVAVKILFKNFLARTATSRDRFLREVRATARLSHPGIVRVIAAGEEGELSYYAMELVDGRSLDAVQAEEGGVLRGEGLRRALEWVREVAEALHAAHAAGIVHRDVKPQNILIERDGRARLVDFGIALDERFGQISRTGELVGTPSYMSPEQLRSSRDGVDARTDVYSLGVVLFELLTGRRPYQGTTVIELLQGIERGDAPRVGALNPDLPKPLQWICERAIEVVPSERYGSARELARDLERFLTGKLPRAQGRGRLVRARRFVARRQLVAGMGAAALLALWIGQRIGVSHGAEPLVRIAVDSDPTGAVVRAIEVDPLTRLAIEDGDVRVLGRTPLRAADLPTGCWLIRLEHRRRVIGEVHRAFVGAGREHDLGLFREVRPERLREMRPIAAGPFTFGDLTADLPAFAIDATEVSNAQYLQFVLATGHRSPELWPDDWRDGLAPEWAERPVVDVTIEDAHAYAAWAGVRLPTWYEWQRATRGPDAWEYPWGGGYGPADHDAEKANLRWKGREDLPVDPYLPRDANNGRLIDVVRAGYLAMCLPAVQPEPYRGPEGLHRSLGNVREWTANCDLHGAAGSWAPNEGFYWVAGRSWLFDEGSLIPRAVTPGDVRNEALGFRCVAVQPAN